MTDTKEGERSGTERAAILLLTLGEKEAAEGMVSVRKHGAGDLGSMSIEDFKQQIIKEITV